MADLRPSAPQMLFITDANRSEINAFLKAGDFSSKAVSGLMQQFRSDAYELATPARRPSIARQWWMYYHPNKKDSCCMAIAEYVNGKYLITLKVGKEVVAFAQNSALLATERKIQAPSNHVTTLFGGNAFSGVSTVIHDPMGFFAEQLKRSGRPQP